ncbi:Protein of unknown function DUF58 [Brevibacterium iodinum ATCC 49514]|uniref:DUF58 domain-containing protein n=1 Tax=Brevibacterium iodinum ATCC 49514 TaxID=1255616 RepID=A0A2H1JZG6_9MICO|nr:DUF58 domain-containing protein [Brevibacterium iodinum]SMX92678.1 Protein of unknown function DUF58 [Brevibacterium iodinum ATCC 49514]SUW13234.1 Uncharacterized conserved protein (some members contain a von Willebrand factor type A (vWA) domain) [Brevibacterium iodinum]
MTVLLNRIKARLTIHAHRRTRRLLDGDYSSVFHGHSLDFDDLRDYIPGDEIRDIDWKATARHTEPLVKRYVAHRRHILGLVVDTSRNFDAVTSAGADKRHLAILMAGMVGYLAVRHADDVMLIHGNAGHTTASPRKGSEAHLEHLLQQILAETGSDSPGSINTQLQWITSHINHRMLLVVISDQAPLGPEAEATIRRLRAQHEVLWITITDADLAGLPPASAPFDIARPDHGLPTSVMTKPEVRQEFALAEAARRQQRIDLLSKLGIAHIEIDHPKSALGRLHTLLLRHRRGPR